MIYLILLSTFAFGAKFENRCGWWDNPTPGNVDFTDKAGTWTISTQGAEDSAQDDWGPSGEMETLNRNYGRYCVCIKVTTKTTKKSKKILKIKSGTTKLLEDCYNDKSLPGYEAPATGALKDFVGAWTSKNEDCIADREFIIRPKHISVGGETSYGFKVAQEKPLWLEYDFSDEPTGKFQRLTKMKNGEIKMEGSSSVKEKTDGVECILSKTK